MEAGRKPLDPWFLVTQDDLDTGHITLVECKPNGQIKNSFRRRACNIKPVHVAYCVQFNPFEHVVEDRVGGNAAMNSDLTMTLLIIDILEGAKARGEFLFDLMETATGGRRTLRFTHLDIWRWKLQRFDHSRLIDPMDAYDIRRRMYEAELA
ncbi:uncharacterized protein BDV14DRAFT_195827 [Aspergillus stella-maris]|uniref:uncharacterized protein n=1 Tax=Aspergillus stella-maris TaxID=1810926 RepID=UPI003CCE078D